MLTGMRKTGTNLKLHTISMAYLDYTVVVFSYAQNNGLLRNTENNQTNICNISFHIKIYSNIN